jgi:hypothetical protein
LYLFLIFYFIFFIILDSTPLKNNLDLFKENNNEILGLKNSDNNQILVNKNYLTISSNLNHKIENENEGKIKIS